MKGIEILEIDFIFDSLKSKSFFIGFFLCVYLFVFEIEKIVKNIVIFYYLKDYVICYVINEINNDDFNSMKILFFFLLFYIS